MKNIFLITGLLSLIFVVSGCNNIYPQMAGHKNLDLSPSNSQSQNIEDNIFSFSKTKTFSDSKADFTFVYPASWTYTQDSRVNQNSLFNKQVPTLYTWNFSSETGPILNIEARVEDARAFGGCSSDQPERRRHLMSLQTFPTNDSKTNIVVEMCALCADSNLNSLDHTEPCQLEELPYQTFIYWVPNQKINSYLDIFKTAEGEVNVHRISFSSQFLEKKSFTKDQYFELVSRIAKSIRTN